MAPRRTSRSAWRKARQPPRERRGTLRPSRCAVLQPPPARRHRPPPRVACPSPSPSPPPSSSSPSSYQPATAVGRHSSVSTIATSPSSGSSLAPPDASSEVARRRPGSETRRSARLRHWTPGGGSVVVGGGEGARASGWRKASPPPAPPMATPPRPRPSAPHRGVGGAKRTCPATPTWRPMTFPAVGAAGRCGGRRRCRAGDGFVGLSAAAESTRIRASEMSSECGRSSSAELASGLPRPRHRPCRRHCRRPLRRRPRRPHRPHHHAPMRRSYTRGVGLRARACRMRRR